MLLHQGKFYHPYVTHAMTSTRTAIRRVQIWTTTSLPSSPNGNHQNLIETIITTELEQPNFRYSLRDMLLIIPPLNPTCFRDEITNKLRRVKASRYWIWQESSVKSGIQIFLLESKKFWEEYKRALQKDKEPANRWTLWIDFRKVEVSGVSNRPCNL